MHTHLKNEITNWLNGPREYYAGAALYLSHGKDPVLKRVFSEPPNDFKRKKLVEALRGLITTQVKVETQVEASKTTVIATEKRAERQWPEQRDETLQALHLQWKPIFAEMMNLMNRIFDVAVLGQSDPYNKILAGQMAHRILDLDDMCDELYAKRDHYLQHGKLPAHETPMELVVDPMKIPLALQNAKRYAREYRAKLVKNPADENAAQQLKKWEWAVGEYEKTLKLN